MLAYVLKRLIAMPFLLLGVASVSFLMSQATKGNPLAAIVPERMMDNPEIVAAAKAPVQTSPTSSVPRDAMTSRQERNAK